MAKRKTTRKKTKKKTVRKNDLPPPPVEDDEFEGDPEDELTAMKVATGIKDKGGNMTGITQAKKRAQDGVKKEVKRPSLFVKKDAKIRVEADVLYSDDDGIPLLFVLSIPGIEKKELSYLQRVTYWAEFSHPRYDDVLSYREACLKYITDAEQFLVDPVQMRINFIRSHLKDWNLEDEKGNIIKLKHEGEMLTQESMDLVGSAHTTLMDIFLTEFERQAALT